MNQIDSLASRQRYKEARTLAKYLRWLHPADGLPEYPKLLQAQEMAQLGDLDGAVKILSRYRNVKTPLGRTSIGLLYRIAGRWQDLLLWSRKTWTEESLQADPQLMFYYLRALGETGDLNGLLQGADHFERIVVRTGDRTRLILVRMMAFAFCGQPEQVQLIFNRHLPNYSQNFRIFWLATADRAAGNELGARKALIELCNSSDAALRNAANWRLAQTPVNPRTILTQPSQQILERIDRELQQEVFYGNPSHLFSQKAYGTFGLIGVNIIVFAIELISGGSQDLEVLYHLGALVPTVVWYGEWWRLLSATFLHYGFFHLVLNMIGLAYLGVFVEIRLGILKYLVAYLFCGIGSMLVVTILAVSLNSEPQVTVGASGAIMGMVGATGSILLQGWRREKSRIAAQRLRSILYIIGLQMVFDLITPNVSFVGHTSGVVLGFLVGILLYLKKNWNF
ncbi:MAG: rhomboid family intramembrane serine protease [Pseudanabaena sp. SU_2_4]|nr:rhomboid family intramembrane serine protease [Pseudanabaena sp. SU_2_4]